MDINKFEVFNHPCVIPNTLRVSPQGKVNDSRGIHNPTYLSTNGYMYEFVQTNDGMMILFPFDIIMASTFIPIPQELKNKPIKVIHKNGNNADCYYDNLEWIEDIEEWRDVDYGDIKRGYYQVSNHGRIRSMLSDPPLIMKPNLGVHGYYRISLVNNDGTQNLYTIHRLVGHVFVNGYKPDLQVNHIDGIKTHNDWYNLEWVTIRENTKHAYMLNLAENHLRKISEDDARIICLSLNRNNGSIMKAYNELKDVIDGLTYPIVSSIKYGDTFIEVSNKYLNKCGRNKQIRQTDPDVILEVSYCLKENNGDVKKTKKQLEGKYPWISYGWLWHLKDKSVGSEVTDLVFTKDEFPKCIPLTENDAIMIIECLLKHRGDPYVTQTVFDELKDSIEGLTKDKVRSIKEKKAWKNLSDKYFNKGDI